MIIGRENHKSALLEGIVENLNKLGQGVQDKLGMTSLISDNCLIPKLTRCAGQDQTVIGRAAVAAARMAEAGKAPSKYWVLEMGDIVKLGRDEWKE
jgi:hypothetical protein